MLCWRRAALPALPAPAGPPAAALRSRAAARRRCAARAQLCAAARGSSGVELIDAAVILAPSRARPGCYTRELLGSECTRMLLVVFPFLGSSLLPHLEAEKLLCLFFHLTFGGLNKI